MNRRNFLLLTAGAAAATAVAPRLEFLLPASKLALHEPWQEYRGFGVYQDFMRSRLSLTTYFLKPQRWLPREAPVLGVYTEACEYPNTQRELQDLVDFLIDNTLQHLPPDVPRRPTPLGKVVFVPSSHGLRRIVG